MSELLLELFSEEIPALMQKNAAESYKDIFTTILQENDITSQVQLYIGPRRIAVHISDLPSILPPKEMEIRGPKITAPDSAITGFCRANNIERKKLSTSLVQGQLYYIINKKTAVMEVQSLLAQIILKAISKYTWPKSMRWGNYDISWVRPIRNILCIFDGKILPVKYGHLQANNITFGHRFINPEPLIINDFADYRAKLIKAHVVLSQIERMELIKKQLEFIGQSLNLIIKEDKKLLEEVTGLVEFPVVMLGKIPEKFLTLPTEVLVSSMKSHQKYFNTFDQSGNFAPYFLFVSNMPSDREMIIKGNEKVLAARLSDALYFYQQDLSSTLESRLAKLEQITFHAKIGTMRQKVVRIGDICRLISPENQSENQDLQIAVRFCKSDLTSEMVGEFPELQGIMGYYYAKAEGLSHEIASAIRDHYKPQGPLDEVPIGSAAIIAMADKLDNLIGLILAGEEPSGSRDPYSLRRQAIGIIKIILANKFTINLKQLIENIIALYPKTVPMASQGILKFLEERAKYYFKDYYNISLINAIIDFNIEQDLVISGMKLKALQKFLIGINGHNLLTIYKRVNNILKDRWIEGEINPNLFVSSYESQLFTSMQHVSAQINNYILERDFTKTLNVLLEILQPINEVFDHLMIKDPDPQIASNRLLLLQGIKQLFNKLANFSCL